MKANSLNVVSVNRKVAITGQRNSLTRLATNSSRAIRVAFGRLAALRQVARSGHEAKHRATVLDPKAAQLPKYRAILRQASLSSYIAFTDRAKAGAFERYLKSGSGHAFARKHLWKSCFALTRFAGLASFIARSRMPSEASAKEG